MVKVVSAEPSLAPPPPEPPLPSLWTKFKVNVRFDVVLDGCPWPACTSTYVTVTVKVFVCPLFNVSFSSIPLVSNDIYSFSVVVVFILSTLASIFPLFSIPIVYVTLSPGLIKAALKLADNLLVWFMECVISPTVVYLSPVLVAVLSGVILTISISHLLSIVDVPVILKFVENVEYYK